MSRHSPPPTSIVTRIDSAIGALLALSIVGFALVTIVDGYGRWQNVFGLAVMFAAAWLCSKEIRRR